ncbi:MAG: CRTAC1 family protein [Candidatus Latescibacterota bacterium]
MARADSRRRRALRRTAVLATLAGVCLVGAALLRPQPEAYVPGEQVEGLTDELGRPLPADHPQVRFADVTAASGIAFRHFYGTRSSQLPEDMGSGAAWGDYDGDGDLDLYAVNTSAPLTATPAEVAASPAHAALYRNRGDGTFEEVSAAAGVDFRGCGQAAAWGDYDGDGRLDLCVTAYGRLVLYHNEGDGTFVEESARAGMRPPEGFWSGASWADYDRDGDVDLYVCGYVQYRPDPAHQSARTRQYDILTPASLNPSTYPPQRNLLYRNEGNRTFTEVAAAAEVANPEGRSLSAVWSDLDGDGWTDLYVANDLSDNVLYRNRGDGTFADVSHAAWVADYRGAMGLAAADWDGDGDQDLFITHWIAQENALYASLQADYRAARLDTAQASLRFMDVADRVGLGQIALDYVGWGAAFTDYDGDGREDLLVVNGSTFQRDDDPRLLEGMRPQLFWNRSNEEGLFEVGRVSGEVFAQEVVGRGLAMGDYDDDGDADAFVVVNGGLGVLLRNDGGNQRGWLKVRLRGRESNRFGLGARVRLVAGGRTQRRELEGGSSYYSQHAVGEVLFGLADASVVDTLEVTWPGGRKQVLTGLPANRVVRLEEGAAAELALGRTP